MAISSINDLSDVLAQLDAASADGRLTSEAAENCRRWLTDPSYADFAPPVAAHVRENRWQALDDAFWTIIPFGTGGRRGRMYPIGTNAINERTIAESAQGMADYVKEHLCPEGELAAAVAYDTRHRSRRFAELCSEVLVAAGFKIYFLDGYRSTPELSVAVRTKRCACGFMITASHNPPSDNAVKVYGPSGGQLLPPHDKGVIDRVMNVETIRRGEFTRSLASGDIVYCQEEVDRVYQQAVLAQGFGGPRDLKVLYSPMHGVGATSIVPVLRHAGFERVEVFGPHAEADPDFSNVPGHVANPENPETFTAMIESAQQSGADVILSSDPDADRLGCAAALVPGGMWRSFTGNQIGALLAHYVLGRRRAAGDLTPDHFVVKTLVTTELIRRIADSFGVRTEGNLLVGFKWIAGVIDRDGPDRFVFGAEESHGYLVGTFSRDKDAAGAALLLAELAAELKAHGMTLHQRLDALQLQYGCHAEMTVSLTMPGSEGMERMRRLMQRFRDESPATVGGLRVARICDYLNLVETADGSPRPLDGPQGDLIFFNLEAPGNCVAVRPSGTEPKVKFYLFGYLPPDASTDLDAARGTLSTRLEAIRRDLAAVAEST